MASTDEDTFVLSASWQQVLVPRRGGAKGPALTPAAGAQAAREIISRNRSELTVALDQNDHLQDLMTAARAYLDDMGAPEACGAGVALAVVGRLVDWSGHDRAWLGDLLVADGGVVRAAEAVAEMAGVSVQVYKGIGPAGFVCRVERDPADQRHPEPPTLWAVAARVRAYLAEASDEDYAAAAAALGAYRGRDPSTRVLTSFLLPTCHDWVAADCTREVSTSWASDTMMLCSVNTVRQADWLADKLTGEYDTAQLYAMVTVLDGVGPAAAPVFLRWFDSREATVDMRERILGVLTRVPTDEAFALVLSRLDDKYAQQAIPAMVKRFPRRAIRLLAGALTVATSSAPRVRALLRAHALAHPELVAEVLPTLPAPVAAALADVSARRPVATAPDKDLPAFLINPPWMDKRRSAAKPGVPVLTRPDTRHLGWNPGEREKWERDEHGFSRWTEFDRSWEQVAADFAGGRLHSFQEMDFFFGAPAELAVSALRTWLPRRYAYDAEEQLRALTIRFGLEAFPIVLAWARVQPAARATLLGPFFTPELADLMADWLARLRATRPVAVNWLNRHATDAARALLPAALGKAGVARRHAEIALRGIAASGRDTEVLSAAKEYGDAAVAATESLLRADPLDFYPARIPVLPVWTDAGLLPPVLLGDRTTALPADAVRNLCTMLAMSTVDAGYAGLAMTRELCDHRSLADFGWALFEQWQAFGAPSKDAWAFTALRWLGDETTVRRLVPLIRTWPGDGGHGRSVTGLDILAGIGTDFALMQLYLISQKVKFKGLRERASQKIAEVAKELGLTSEQLADRLVPDLGLDAAGSLSLDYGPRRFTVAFDEQLKPYVATEDGSRRAALPKPGSNDDPVLGPAAYQRFTALKKDVRTIASEQIGRFELAMVNQRRWTGRELRELFIAHPVLWHIVRRLLWVSDTPGGLVAFRIAEDRTFSDVTDETFVVGDDTSVGIAHPRQLADQVVEWSQLFADYEILQPFAQLGREVHLLTAEEQGQTNLARFTGFEVAAHKVVGLERRGWRRGDAEDGGARSWMQRTIPGGRTVVANIEPGMIVGVPVDECPAQQFTEIWVSTKAHGGSYRVDNAVPFGELDPVLTSELLRDLIEATSS